MNEPTAKAALDAEKRSIQKYLRADPSDIDRDPELHALHAEVRDGSGARRRLAEIEYADLATAYFRRMGQELASILLAAEVLLGKKPDIASVDANAYQASLAGLGQHIAYDDAVTMLRIRYSIQVVNKELAKRVRAGSFTLPAGCHGSEDAIASQLETESRN